MILRCTCITTLACLLTSCAEPAGSAVDTDTTTGGADTSTTAPTTTTTTSTTTTSATTTTSTTTSDPDTSSGTTDTAECEASSECSDPLLPICARGTCVACTDADDGDAACFDADDGTPVCAADGSCVECTAKSTAACGDTTPVCDDATRTCVGCTFHEQCDEACDIATGACFTDDCVIDVNLATSISESIGDGCVLRIAELPGGLDYEENLILLGNKVALIAVEGATPRIVGELGSPTIWITGGATVYMQGLEVVGFQDPAVQISDSSAWLDRSTVIGYAMGGIDLENDSYASVRNGFVVTGTNTVSIYAANSSLDLLYSTVHAGFGTASALECTAVGTINVRNSILVTAGDSPEIGCTTDVFDDNLTEIQLGNPDLDWFMDVDIGDLHLSALAPGVILSAAQWRVGDPLVDIDGDLRPTMNDADDVAGADVP